jgi:signal peptidase I
MLRLIKIRGHSLHPDYQDGDYVLVARVPFPSGKIRAGDVILFHQPGYPLMIKRVHRVLEGGKSYEVRGTQIDSTDSRNFGSVPKELVAEKVIWHIAKKSKGTNQS